MKRQSIMDRHPRRDGTVTQAISAQIDLVNASGEITRASITGTCQWKGPIPQCRLSLSAGEISVTGEGSDYFDAFCRIREELAARELVPRCYGASRNVYPSGMGRDMGLGLKAYRMTPGRHVTADDLVHIFESGPDVDPASVGEQEAFAATWRTSNRSF
jgi:hypothetical protein